jgi:hypothetical protein
LANAAAGGNPPAAIRARAGHASFSTTQLYIDLARVAFSDEAQAAEGPRYFTLRLSRAMLS